MEQNFKKPKKLSKRNNPKSKIKFNKRNIKTLIHTLKREKAFDRLLEISNDKNDSDEASSSSTSKIQSPKINLANHGHASCDNITTPFKNHNTRDPLSDHYDLTITDEALINDPFLQGHNNLQTCMPTLPTTFSGPYLSTPMHHGNIWLDGVQTRNQSRSNPLNNKTGDFYNLSIKDLPLCPDDEDEDYELKGSDKEGDDYDGEEDDDDQNDEEDDDSSSSISDMLTCSDSDNSNSWESCSDPEITPTKITRQQEPIMNWNEILPESYQALEKIDPITREEYFGDIQTTPPTRIDSQAHLPDILKSSSFKKSRPNSPRMRCETPEYRRSPRRSYNRKVSVCSTLTDTSDLSRGTSPNPVAMPEDKLWEEFLKELEEQQFFQEDPNDNIKDISEQDHPPGSNQTTHTENEISDPSFNIMEAETIEKKRPDLKDLDYEETRNYRIKKDEMVSLYTDLQEIKVPQDNVQQTVGQLFLDEILEDIALKKTPAMRKVGFPSTENCSNISSEVHVNCIKKDPRSIESNDTLTSKPKPKKKIIKIMVSKKMSPKDIQKMIKNNNLPKGSLIDQKGNTLVRHETLTNLNTNQIFENSPEKEEKSSERLWSKHPMRPSSYSLNSTQNFVNPKSNKMKRRILQTSGKDFRPYILTF